MRGETQILLFDAKTEKKVFEKKEKNIVTNAISKLLSPKNEWLFGNSAANIMAAMGNMIPFSTRAFGGIMLFDSELTEDPSIVLPPLSVKNVGYAGGAYSGNNKLRGTYNSNESGEITGGYRHVWDFGTDRANGAISSVCLTSVVGGNSGWVQPAEGDTSVAGIGSIGNFVTPSNFWTLKITHGKPLFVKKAPESGKIESINIHNGELFKVLEPNLNELSLSSRFNIGESKSYEFTRLAGLVLPGHSYSNSRQRTYYMDGKIHFLTSGDGNVASSTINHQIYTLDGVLESNTTITTATTYYGQYGPLFYFKGKYFAPTTNAGTTLSVFEPDGTLAQTIPFGTAPSLSTTNGFALLAASYIPQLDAIVLTQRESGGYPTYAYFLNSNFELTAIYMSSQSYTPVGFVATEEDIAPYVLLTSFAGDSTGETRVYLGTWMNYLGTINNLSTPVTKSSSQTMKIVYSIYDD